MSGHTSLNYAYNYTVALKSVLENEIPPQIGQMLLVLQGIHRTPPTEDYFTLVGLLSHVVRPYQCLVPRLRNYPETDSEPNTHTHTHTHTHTQSPFLSLFSLSLSHSLPSLPPPSSLSAGGRTSRAETMAGRDSPSMARSESPVKRRHSFTSAVEHDLEESGRGESPLVSKRSPQPV